MRVPAVAHGLPVARLSCRQSCHCDSFPLYQHIFLPPPPTNLNILLRHLPSSKSTLQVSKHRSNRTELDLPLPSNRAFSTVTLPKWRPSGPTRTLPSRSISKSPRRSCLPRFVLYERFNRSNSKLNSWTPDRTTIFKEPLSSLPCSRSKHAR